MKRIMVVEDDTFLRKNITNLLLRKGYQVLTASCIAEAMQLIQNNAEVDLYLLDLWLPDGEGFTICERIRRESFTPVLFLTACDDEESVVKGLELGADDYIVKPFRSAELLARVQANVRRNTVLEKADCYVSDKLFLDTGACVVEKDGHRLPLRPMEYELLLFLINHPGQIIKREQLLSRIWDEEGNFIEDNTLSVQMSRLRKAIGADYIETVRGFGYRYTKEVRKASK